MWGKIQTDTINLLAKAYTHVQMKAIGVKITIVTSASLNVGHLRLKKKKQKDEQMDGLVVSANKSSNAFCYFRVSLGRETLKWDSYMFKQGLNASSGEFRRISDVHALWADRHHPYTESLLTL